MAEAAAAQTEQSSTVQGNTDTGLLTPESQTTTPTSTQTDGTTEANWRDSLPEDIRPNEAFAQFKDSGELAKSFLDLKKQSDELTQAKADLEAKIPKVADTPEGYTIDVPEGVPVDAEFVSAMQAAAHKYGLGVEQFQNFAKDYVAMQQAYIAKVQGEQEAALNALKIEWGNKYDTNVTIAQQAFKKFAPSDEESKYIKETGLANDPVLVRMFQRVGAAIAEDTPVGGDGGVGAGGPDSGGKPMLDFSKSWPKK